MQKLLYLSLLWCFATLSHAQNKVDITQMQNTLIQIGFYKGQPRPKGAVSLYQALQAGWVKVSINGSDIQSVEISLSSNVNYTLQIALAAGTYFVCNGLAQNMVGRESKQITLRPSAAQHITLAAACANRPKDIPDSHDRFEVAPSPHQTELSKLMPLLEKKVVDYTTAQAAVWIVTDDADFTDLGILSDGYSRVIDCSAAVRAMQYCEKAGINIKSKSIWADRVYLQDCLTNQQLKDWLKKY